MGQLKEQSGLQPLGIVTLYPQFQGHPVRFREGQRKLISNEQIGIGAHHFQRHISIRPIQRAGQGHRQLMIGQKLHQAAHSHLGSERLADLPGALRGDSFDTGELFRLLLNHSQRIFSKCFDQQAGRGLSHALDRTGRKIMKHFLQALRQAPLYGFRLELGAVGGVTHP